MRFFVPKGKIVLVYNELLAGKIYIFQLWLDGE